MNLLSLEQAQKSYGEKVLLKQANFYLNEGEKVGIIGINGTGKTTLLRILAGIEVPDEGSRTVANHVVLRFLEQNPQMPADMSVLEYVLQGEKEEDRWILEPDAKTLLMTFELNDFNQPCGQLSGGQKKRAALAKTLLRPADILILDEPTNHLDTKMADWLEDYLRRYRGAMIMVTHDRYFLDQVTNHITELDHASLYSYETNYSGYLQKKAEREQNEDSAAAKRKNLLRTELEWLNRGARARSTKQKAHIQRIENLQEQRGPVRDRTVQLDSVASRLGKTTIELEHISKGFGDKHLINDFSYIVLRDDRIGFIGPNGCGKSTLMKMIMGILQPDEGNITIGDTVKIGYFAQENEDMTGDIRVIDYIRNVAEYIQTTKGQASASQMLDRFLFPPELQYTPLDKLSGGEQRRLYLLKVLMEAPNVLILDEPTNDLDIQTLTILEDYLDTFAGIVITVSHDRYFLDRIVNRIFAFEEGGHLKQYEGGYTDYLEKVKPIAKQEKSKPEKKENNGKKFQKEHQKKLKFTYKEQKEFETIDDDIAKLEEKIEQLDEEIMENATNSGKLAELTQQKEETEEALNEKMDRWVYLNDLAEQIANQ